MLNDETIPTKYIYCVSVVEGVGVGDVAGTQLLTY